jgi:hypothetical protein
LRESLQIGLGSGVIGKGHGISRARFEHAKRVWRTKTKQIAQV